MLFRSEPGSQYAVSGSIHGVEKARIDRVISLASQGATVAELAEALGMDQADMWRFIDSDKSLRQAYSQARARGYDALADSLLTIPEQIQDVQVARLKSENIRWLLSKRRAEVYGDKLQVDVSGQVDLTAIMAESAQRLRPMRDLQPLTIDASPIESGAYALPATDKQSESGELQSIDDLLA